MFLFFYIGFLLLQQNDLKPCPFPLKPDVTHLSNTHSLSLSSKDRDRSLDLHLPQMNKIKSQSTFIMSACPWVYPTNWVRSHVLCTSSIWSGVKIHFATEENGKLFAISNSLHNDLDPFSMLLDKYHNIPNL